MRLEVRGFNRRIYKVLKASKIVATSPEAKSKQSEILSIAIEVESVKYRVFVESLMTNSIQLIPSSDLYLINPGHLR